MIRVIQHAMRKIFQKGATLTKASDGYAQKVLSALNKSKAKSATRQKAADAIIDITAKYGDDIKVMASNANKADASILDEKTLTGMADIIKDHGLGFSDDVSTAVKDMAVNLSSKKGWEASKFVNNIHDASRKNAFAKIGGVTNDLIDSKTGQLNKRGRSYFQSMGMDDIHISRMEERLLDAVTDPTISSAKFEKMAPNIMMRNLEDMKYQSELNRMIANHAHEIGMNPTLYKNVKKINPDDIDLLDDLYTSFDLPSTQLKEKALKRSYAAIKSGRKAMGMEQVAPGALGSIMAKTTTIDTKVDKAIQIAMEAGNVNAALHTANFDNMLRHAAAASAHSQGMMTYMSSKLSVLDDAQDAALKTYTINRARHGTKLYKVPKDGKSIDVDLEVIAAMNGKKKFKTPEGEVLPVRSNVFRSVAGKEGSRLKHIHGEKMDVDLAALSNQLTNSQRRLMKYQKNARFGRPDMMDIITENPENIPSTHIEFRGKRFSTDTVGDLGENYVPLRWTDDRLASMKKNNIDDVDAFGALDGTSSLESSRKAHSKMEVEPWATKRLDESIKSYGYKYSGALERGLTTESLNTAEAAFALSDQFISPQMARTGESMRGARNQTDVFRNIRKHLESVFDDRMSMTGGETVAAEISKPAMRLFYAYTHMNRSLMLSSPKFSFLNRFQPMSMRFTNESIGKAFVDNIGGVFDSDRRLIKSLFKKKGVKNVVKELRENKNLSARDRYVIGNYFDTYMTDLSAAMIHLNESPMLRKVGDVVSLPFTSGDIAARVSVAKTASKNLDDAVRKYAGDPARIKSEAAIDALNYQDQSRVMAALKRADFQAVNKDAASHYTNAVINKKLFNYGKFGKPEIVDAARRNPIAALAVAFTTWPQYWGNTMRTITRAFKDGNKKPMQRMIVSAASWWGAFGLAYKSIEDTDGSFAGFARDFSRYGMRRTPIFSPVTGVLEMLNRPVAGIGADAAGTLNYMVNYPMRSLQRNLLGMEKTSVDYTMTKSLQHIKGSAFRTKAKDIEDLWEAIK